jgi:hypothetical protein
MRELTGTDIIACGCSGSAGSPGWNARRLHPVTAELPPWPASCAAGATRIAGSAAYRCTAAMRVCNPYQYRARLPGGNKFCDTHGCLFAGGISAGSAIAPLSSLARRQPDRESPPRTASVRERIGSTLWPPAVTVAERWLRSADSAMVIVAYGCFAGSPVPPPRCATTAPAGSCTGIRSR